ncbi:MAG: MscL family protein, partial [Iodobacter sp.]
PPIAILMGKVDFTNLYFLLAEGKTAAPYATLDAAQKAGAVTLNYGVFLNVLISFVIVTFSVFLVIKTLNNLKREEAVAPAAPAATPDDIALLREIRDLLKK